MTEVTTTVRKDDHIRINLEHDVQSNGVSNGLEGLYFDHQAAPEFDMTAVDTTLTVFGRPLSVPLLISCMTGGTRIVRDVAPDVLLHANLGAGQLNYGIALEDCRRIIEMAQADVLVLHFNALQEALQPEGNTNFSGLLAKVEQVCSALARDGVPVVAKEVGWGFSEETCRALAAAGVAAIDVAGAGGTSWSQVEMHRSENEIQKKVATAFADWGISTAKALCNARNCSPEIIVIASGGLRNGVDVAKSIALGASLAGIARPFLEAAVRSSEAVLQAVQIIEEQLRISMFCAGSKDIGELQQTRLLQR